MTRSINSKAVLAAATRVASEWRANPALFSEAHISLESFEGHLSAATTAANTGRNTRDAVVAEKSRLRAIALEKKLAADAERKAAEAALDTQRNTATAAEFELVRELSRLTSGIKYSAKAKALSDTDDANDAAAKRL